MTRPDVPHDSTALPSNPYNPHAWVIGEPIIGEGTWTAGVWTSDLGVLDVTGTAYLVHPEHAALGIGPGRYALRRQREHTRHGATEVDD